MIRLPPPSEKTFEDPENVYYKVPLFMAPVVEGFLRFRGVDFGTDGYYADPHHFYTVIIEK